MKVKLINVAEYEIKEDKVTNIPFDVFVKLCGNSETPNAEDLQKVRLFKSVDEFKNLSNAEMEEINQAENVRILQNGQFLVFLGNKWDKKENNTAAKRNATADTEENKGK